MKIFLKLESLIEIEKFEELGIVDGIYKIHEYTIEELANNKDSLNKEFKTLKQKTILQTKLNSDDDIVELSKELAKLSNHIVVEHEFNREVVVAHQYLKRIGIEVSLKKVENLSQALIASKSGIQFLTVEFDSNYELIENILDSLDVYHLKTELIVDNVESQETFEKLSQLGVDIVIVKPEFINSIFKSLSS